MKPVVQVSYPELPPDLYHKLLIAARKEWKTLPDQKRWVLQFEYFKHMLSAFSSKGSSIWFYEVPMDTCIYNSKLLALQRSMLEQLAKTRGYHFLRNDVARNYKTTDGIHIPDTETDRYSRFF